MSKRADIFDVEQWKESEDREFKLASGKDGFGSLPDSVWETYSAMANTMGGTIFLGVKELPNRRIEIVGVENPEKVVKEFWNQANNRQKISCNLMSSDRVEQLRHDGRILVAIHVPRASRKDRPVFVGTNPMTGTYRRQNDGDYRCPEDVVQRMIAEKTADTLDAGICNRYTLEDIDGLSLAAYRKMFAAGRPAHPFNAKSDLEFLKDLGGWRRDRETGEEGLTAAGLLMFGKLRSILDAFPKYIVDYREYGRETDGDQRWEDRLTTDFSWPGNLFSFCRMVLPRLYQTLKIPFRMKGGQRVDDSPVHVALREALVNTVIHADYGEGGAILVVKRPDLFGFRNPGMLRIPKEEAIRGGAMNSDCRNRNLQKMFQMIGYAEQAGSGFPKIYSGWASQDWKKPDLREDFEQRQTYLVLRMTSLLPEESIAAAMAEFGSRFSSLSQLKRLAVVTAFAEEEVTHSRLMELCTDHQADVSRALRDLVREGFLVSDGYGRGMRYCPNVSRSETGGPSSGEKGPSSGEKGPSSGEKGPSSTLHALNRKQRECLVALAEKRERSIVGLMEDLSRTNRSKFRRSILAPLLLAHYVEPVLVPPQHPRQRYRLTKEGVEIVGSMDKIPE